MSAGMALLAFGPNCRIVLIARTRWLGSKSSISLIHWSSVLPATCDGQSAPACALGSAFGAIFASTFAAAFGSTLAPAFGGAFGSAFGGWPAADTVSAATSRMANEVRIL